MATADIVMPRLSDTMEEGTILRWLKSDGELVARGEELVEIETDKATMTYESDQEGVLEIVAGAGHTLEVGAVIARVGAAGGADTGNAGAAQTDGVPASATNATGATAATSAPTPAGAPAAAQSASAGAGAAPGEEPGARVKASPLARRIAAEDGIDLHGVSGSGPGGRIVKADVLARGRAGAGGETSGDATEGGTTDGGTTDGGTTGAGVEPEGGDRAPSAAGPLEAVATAKGHTTEIELTRTQQTIARRMAESKATIPDFALVLDVDMSACAALRAELKRLAQHERAPTYNDMVVKASALALREHPNANGSYRDGRLHLHSRVNVGVAVAAENALVVPTVFDADEKSLGEIARETQALAERVRSATITPPELGGGTFTVSNLGMYGVRSFSAIINPPQAAILSVGAVERRAVADGEEVRVSETMTLTLVCDHRILFGAEAAQFLARMRELLQTPSALTL